MDIGTTNIILYCRKWKEAVAFYKVVLGLPVMESGGWFFEFKMNNASRLSIADASRTSIDSNEGRGITITLQVKDINATRQSLCASGIEPLPIKHHPWGADVFHVFDPEGNRLEFWCPDTGEADLANASETTD